MLPKNGTGKQVGHSRRKEMEGLKWRQPCQPHPGTQGHCYRCSLPGLAEFTAACCGGTDRAAITLAVSEGGIVAEGMQQCNWSGRYSGAATVSQSSSTSWRKASAGIGLPIR